MSVFGETEAGSAEEQRAEGYLTPRCAKGSATTELSSRVLSCPARCDSLEEFSGCNRGQFSQRVM